MNKITLLAASLFLTSCMTDPRSTNHETQVRYSFGGGRSDADISSNVSVGGSTFSIDSVANDGNVLLGRVEFNRKTDVIDTAGLYVDVGHTEWDDIFRGLDAAHGSIGGIFRDHFGSIGEVRPYLEVRAGYRHTFLTSNGITNDGGGFEYGVAAGLEFPFTNVNTGFVQIGYDSAAVEIGNVSLDTDGVRIMFGGSLSF